MNFALRLSYLLLVLGCVLESGRAQSNAEYTAKAHQMLAIYDNPSTDINIKIRHLPELVTFYEKFSKQFRLTRGENVGLANLVRRYKAYSVSGADEGPWALILPFSELVVEGIKSARI